MQAQKQMKGYNKVPLWDKVAWKLVRPDEKTGQLLLEGTINTPPTHAALVTGWLKGYVLYDPEKKTVLGVIVTIRGERME